MKRLLDKIKLTASEEIKNVKDLKDLKDLKVKYLGKKGEMMVFLQKISTLSADEKPVFGKMVNDARTYIEKILLEKESILKKKYIEEKLKMQKIDVSMPGRRVKIGGKHPLSIVLSEIENIFLGMGFEICEGPEIEYVYYNFDALNIPINHPSRDIQDTFYINDEVILRTQTSPVQIRVMENKRPPIKLISPGRVYRCDDVDATHSPMFHQIEGLVIDKNVSMSDLKWTLETFVKKLYGDDINIRLRPHHFPFTEPSVEVDITCFACKGEGCRICKGEGFIEILGAGMVHTNVLRNCGLDPNEYSGFAFGLGLDRIVMGKFNIDSLKLMYENDIRFLSQF